jgi:hypothetical protein
MAPELKIRWDGDVPGMAEHRLSVGGFGAALSLLVTALRRIATQMVSTAVESEYSRRGGRFAEVARQIDIEIIDIAKESNGFDAIVSFQPSEGLLASFRDLPERAMLELFNSIERESKGQAANGSVRKYLRALPDGVRRQRYEFHENGITKGHVEIGDVRLAELPEDLASLREYEGNIVGVGFEPGKPEVRVKTESATASLDATNEQVEMALNMKKEKVRVLGVNDDKRTRLLNIVDVRKPRRKVSDEAIEEHIFKRWSGVFARLAK